MRFLLSTLLLATALAVAAWALFFRNDPPPAPGARGFRQPTTSLVTADWFVIDEIVGFRHSPHLSHRAMVTNNLGFREDADTLETKASNTYRILVTGDSHTDEVVYNHKSFPNLLEDLLNSASRGTTFEVINGGVGFSGPYNYAGFARRFLPLEPDMYVVVFYVGNDFMEGLGAAELRGRVEIPARSEDYVAKLAAASGPAVWRGLNQVFLLRTYPELVEPALEIALEQLVEMQSLCETEGIELTIVMLPTLANMGLNLTSPDWTRPLEELGLGPEDAAENWRLGEELLSRLRERGFRTLNLLPAMRNSPEALYRQKDHHINENAHALMARAFFERRGAEILAASKGGT